MTTFNPSDSSNFTLSGGNLTAAVTTFSHGGVRSTTSKSTGKWYFEITGNSISATAFSFNFGIANASWVLTTGGQIGDENSKNSGGCYPGSATGFYVNATITGAAVQATINTAATVFGVAIDFGAQLIWITDDNGTHWNGSTTGQVPGVSGGRSFSTMNAGPYFIAVAGYQNSPADSYTLNTGNSSFANTVPGGFTGWDLTPSSGVVPAPIRRSRYGVGPNDAPNNLWYLKSRQRGKLLPPPQPAVMPYTNRNRYYWQVPQIPERLKPPRVKLLALGSIPVVLPSVLIDAFVREVLVASTAPSAVIDGVVREVLVKDTPPIVISSLVREVLGAYTPGSSPIPIFPTLPYGFPVKFTPNMNTVIGASTSDREVRVPMQQLPLWDIEILFEELRDQTQNNTIFQPMAGFTQYEQLVQLWLSMYGLAGVFAFDCPWDDSRTNQPIGTGDGSTYVFTIFRTWGQGPADIVEPIGMINQVFNVSVNGVTISPSQYYVQRNKIYFIANGFVFPPGAGDEITMTFSFYYVCRFTENNQDYEEFSEGRWTVPSLKFQSVYWP